VQVTLLDGAAAFAGALGRAGELGITVFDAAYLPHDFIDFASPLAPARPAPEGRDPNAFSASGRSRPGRRCTTPSPTMP
jgi:hypothetical protein